MSSLQSIKVRKGIFQKFTFYICQPIHIYPHQKWRDFREHQSSAGGYFGGSEIQKPRMLKVSPFIVTNSITVRFITFNLLIFNSCVHSWTDHDATKIILRSKHLPQSNRRGAFKEDSKVIRGIIIQEPNITPPLLGAWTTAMILSPGHYNYG